MILNFMRLHFLGTSICHRRTFLLVLCLVALSAQPIFCQKEPKRTASPTRCDREAAIQTIQQQIDLSKTIDQVTRRIPILIRAADLLWPFNQAKARATFNDAFQLATQEEENRRFKDARAQNLFSDGLDLRFVVIRALAKRDLTAARMLAEQVQNDDILAESQNPAIRLEVAQKRLVSALQVLPVNLPLAIDIARSSLRYPASFMLTRFLYAVAKADQNKADELYGQALSAYEDRPMREFLYLSTYPFGFSSSMDTPVFGYYGDVIPAAFVPSRALQQFFIRTFLRRAQQAMEVPLDGADDYNGYPGLAHILEVLTKLEPQVSATLPELLTELTQTGERIRVSLPMDAQSELSRSSEAASRSTFVEVLENARTLMVGERRLQFEITTILGVATTEDLSTVLSAIDGISDIEVRELLRDWLYFNHAKTAITSKLFDDAERLASKINLPELRAYLHLGIASELLTKQETHNRGRELLEQAITEAKKAPRTIGAARILLTASNAYVKTDLNRSLSVLAAALEITNQIETPDFQELDRSLIKEIRRKGFRRQVRFYMPGLDPEKTFSELAKVDLDNAAVLTNSLNDKLQRAMAALAVAEVCLQQPSEQPKAKPKLKK
jgi:hypothetical protein